MTDFPLFILAGRPNTGKSTLFNRLVGKKTALASDQPGMTRDWLESKAQLSDLHFQLIDTAGLQDRPANDLARIAGERSEMLFNKADAILLMLDIRAGLLPDDEILAKKFHRLGKPIILIANKCESGTSDLVAMDIFRLGFGDPILISALEKTGFDHLYQKLLPFYQKSTGGLSLKLATSAPAHKSEQKLPFYQKSTGGLSPKLATSAPAHKSEQKLPFCQKSTGGLSPKLATSAPAHKSEQKLPFYQKSTGGLNKEETPKEAVEKPMRFAILGRPNTGKSTLFNHLLGKQRALTGPQAGLTRDSIAESLTWNDHQIILFDTAGLRHISHRQSSSAEQLSSSRSKHVLCFAHVVAIMVEASSFPLKQDLQLIAEAASEGRALMLLVNKWDQVKNQQEALARTREGLERAFPDIGDIPIVTLSALYDENLDVIFSTAWHLYQLWQRRISTAQLNIWLGETVDRHPPPLYRGRRVKLRYITQIAARPPRFALWVSRKGSLPASYQRYLVNALRDHFNWPAVPLRMILKKNVNPYKN